MKDLTAVGDRAPDFELASTEGRPYRLRTMLRDSRVLLVFYPANNTPG